MAASGGVGETDKAEEAIWGGWLGPWPEGWAQVMSGAQISLGARSRCGS